MNRARILSTIVVVVLAVGALAISGLPTLAAGEDGHDHGPPTVEMLTGRSDSPDHVSAQLRLRLDGTGPTNVSNLRDVDHLQLAKLTFAPGQAVDWHLHPGPVIVIVDDGVLTVTSADDCVARDYGPEQVYIEQGPSDVLRVENLPEAEEDTVIYALFFALGLDDDLTVFEDDPGC